MDPLRIEATGDLDVDGMLEVVDGRGIELGPTVLDFLDTRRALVLEHLGTGDPVYGVTTGMGAASEVRLDESSRGAQQETLMLARAVGSAPWLDVREVRAALAVRLRTFLDGDAGVSAELCRRLAEMLNLRLHPAVPRSRIGAAGEIIPLAHLGGCLTGSGEFLHADGTRPARQVLTAAGLEPFGLGPKEGVALIEGVPVTTGLAMIAVREARLLAAQAVAITAAELALVDVNRDPFTEGVARADDELRHVLASVRLLAGPEDSPRALQAPISFRILGPAVARMLRSTADVELSVGRALAGVTDSPAFLDGRFVGTAGFDGFDLAAALDGLRLTTTHLAETAAARLHRMLDGEFTGLPRQLSDRPGLHAGLVAVHKRAVGVVHEMLTQARPSSLGAAETSLGQEDVQSFSIEAAVTCADALTSTRDVLACELLGVVHGTRLTSRPLELTSELDGLLAEITAGIPAGTADRPFGRDVAVLAGRLANGWAGAALSGPPSSHDG